MGFLTRKDQYRNFNGADGIRNNGRKQNPSALSILSVHIRATLLYLNARYGARDGCKPRRRCEQLQRARGTSPVIGKASDGARPLLGRVTRCGGTSSRADWPPLSVWPNGLLPVRNIRRWRWTLDAQSHAIQLFMSYRIRFACTAATNSLQGKRPTSHLVKGLICCLKNQRE